MAKINELGQVLALCRGCQGGKSRFEFAAKDSPFGVVVARGRKPDQNPWENEQTDYQYRLFRCVGCGIGALGVVRMEGIGGRYPGDIAELIRFYPEAKMSLSLPESVPHGIEREFREAERCLEAGCNRAAVALLRSTLDKTVRANGYRAKGSNLKDQIDEVAQDGVITEARRARVHEDVRLLGNDILHDTWRPVSDEEVQLCHHYVQRILEDLYDDRARVLAQLAKVGREPEDKDGESGQGDGSS